MTTYVAIPNGDIDQDSPVTQPLLTAIRDNPIAISEGATGAPRNMPNSLDLYLASGNLVAGGTSIIDLAGYDRLILKATMISNITAATSIQIRFSNDNGASFGAYQTLVTAAAANNSGGTIEADFSLQTGLGIMMAVGSSTAAMSHGGPLTLTVPANANAISIRVNGAGFVSGSFYLFGGGTMS